MIFTRTHLSPTSEVHSLDLDTFLPLNQLVQKCRYGAHFALEGANFRLY